MRRKLEQAMAQPHKVLSMPEYLALVRKVPLPSVEQRRNFVDFVTSAHSWYKHLPWYLPGAPFSFFIDRFAGCDCVILPDGSYAVAEREKRGFHYSDIPTAEYRSRFGFLAYSCSEGTAVFRLNQGPLVIPRDKMVVIPGEDEQPCCLPKPILDLTRVQLTAVIHPVSAACDFWDEVGPESLDKIYWPSEAGGQMTLKKVFERCPQMRAPGYRKEKLERSANSWKLLENCRAAVEKTELMYATKLDPVLHELLEPERRRQKTEMLKAIDRLCTLIHEGDSRGVGVEGQG